MYLFFIYFINHDFNRTLLYQNENLLENENTPPEVLTFEVAAPRQTEGDFTVLIFAKTVQKSY